MTDTKSPLKFLFIRLDKIGDLVCTLPCDEHPLFPSNSEKFWVINKGNEFIAKNSVPTKKFLSLDKARPWKSFRTLFHFVKQNHFDVAFSFQSPWWVNLALLIANVPFRFGVLSQWHSFLFLNFGTRQKRSRAEMHEADYNYEIVDLALRQTLAETILPGSASTTSSATIPTTAPLAEVPVTIPESEVMQSSTIETEKLSTPILKLRATIDEALLTKFDLKVKEYIIIHPGMAGSALNWKQSQYIEFIESLLKNSLKKIAITGTPMDEDYLAKIKDHFKNDSRIVILQNKINTTELLSVIAGCSFLLAPSTGVLHLAASLGVPTVGIFSPIKVQHPTRWRARGNMVSILSPEVSCPAQFKCLYERCPHFNCMDQVTPKAVFNLISNYLN
jgi:ADP-heptose:LPS heptosyltransferase